MRKQTGRQLKHDWRKTPVECNETQVSAYFAASIASLLYHLVELFWVVRDLSQSVLKKVAEPMVAHSALFAKHFETKIACIHRDIDSTITANETQWVTRALFSPVVLDEFQLVDKVFGSVRVTTCTLDPCPS